MDLGSETLFQRSKCSKYSLSQLDVFEIAKGQRYSISLEKCIFVTLEAGS